MKAQVDVICCKSVGTDLSMLDIEDFITEICQLKKEVASLEAKLREREEKQNGEDSVWSIRDEPAAQLSDQRSGNTQDSELSLSLLCYTDAQESMCDSHGSVDQTPTESLGSDCNAGEQQTAETQMRVCSIKLVDCRNPKETIEEATAEKEKSDNDDGNCDDDADFNPLDIDECSDPDVCGTYGDCYNHPGGYSCKCQNGYSNYGNNQSKCIEMDCDQFEPESGEDQTLEKMKRLMSLLKNSCESLNDPHGEIFTGEKLLESLCSSSDELLSDENIADGKMLSHFLGTMENSMRLIGPQLKKPVTRMEMNNTVAEVAVTRSQTRPSGPVTLSTDSALFNTSWETVVGKSYPGFAFAALVSYKDLNSSSDVFHKMSREKSDDKKKSGTFQLNSKVVTAVVSNAETKQLPEPVMLVFTHVKEGVESEGVAYSCVYWDEAEGAWSGQGCKRAWSNSTHTACSCSHLSSFAVLMALYDVKDTFELVLITRVGLALSLVCLFLCILTFQFCRSIQGTRTSIHLHLSICLFIADLVFLCGISSTENQVGCAIVAGLLHFFFLSAFCWMLLEGVQLYRMVVLVFHTTLKHLYLYLVGYGVPLVIVIISASAYPKGYGTDRQSGQRITICLSECVRTRRKRNTVPATVSCWLSLERKFILSFFIPVCIVVILNCFFFIITVWKLAKKFSSLNPDLSILKKIRSFTVTSVAQLCILGGGWIFGFFLFQEKGTEVMMYLFTILNSLQGVFIFIMHCLLYKPVRIEYYNLFVRMCPHKKKEEYSTSNSQLKHLMSRMKNSCESLKGPDRGHVTGQRLLENLCNSTDELLSEGNVADDKTLSHFLNITENSMRLIGPRLKEPVTRMETHNTCFVFAALVSYKNLNSSGDFLQKMSREKSDDNDMRSVTFQLNSKVVTAIISNAETKQLSEPVMLVFTHVEERAESAEVAYSCVYWDVAEGAWSGRGCEEEWSNSTHTVCYWSHFSTFAVLMALYPVQDTFELVLITRLGLALSLVCLFLCILTFRFCRSIQGTRTSIHLHLSICLFIADLVFLCGVSSTQNKVGCAIVAGLLHFFFLSAFCWMLLEGVQLYRMVVLVFHTTLKHLYLYLVGYGVPLVIVIVSAIAYPKGYGTDKHCWLSLDHYFILSFFIPVCIIVILNCFFFIITVWKLAIKFSCLNPDLSKLKQIRNLYGVTAAQQSHRCKAIVVS
ncbi:CD97 antigen-like protein [Labeo rohita]|uniref:CD97 antigen-like protein n=1 Tax=Labeo rohita TaxID=84645 RepID=A0A498P3S9_LABRO|nr:CD97 antigen-like protein [Labeo rohita]